MNTEASRQITANGHDIIIEWKEPDFIYLLLEDFNPEEMIDENSELWAWQKFTGYPLLLHIIRTFVIDNDLLREKNILEIGGGSSCGLGNIRYLRKLTDTVDTGGKIKHHAFGIDLRNAEAIVSKVLAEANKKHPSLKKLEEARMNLSAVESGAIKEYDWADIGQLQDDNGNPLTFDCIFNHRIGPTPGGYEKVTDAALNPGGFYIAFREKESVSNEPVNKKFFKDNKYTDDSFSFSFKPGLTSVKKWYDVTIFQKPLETQKVIKDIQEDIWLILPR